MFTRSHPTGTGPEWQTMHYMTADDVTAVRVGDVTFASVGAREVSA